MANVLDDLVGCAYGSLTGPEGHARFMRLLARSFRSHVIAHQIDRPGHIQTAFAHYDDQGRGMNDLADVASRRTYINPWFASHQVNRLFAEGVAGDEGCIAPSALRRTDFYTDILHPFDIFHSAGFLLEKGSAASVMSVSRSARIGHYQEDELRLGRQLLPHLRNVHALQKLIGSHHFDAADIACPAWLLATDGRICGRKRHASVPAAMDSVIGERAGRLWPTHAQDRVALYAEISDVLAGKRLSARVPLRDKTGTPRCIAHIRHCRREAFLTWLITDPPAALVVLHPIESDASTLEPTLVRLYGLTAAECRVAAKLHQLESIQSVAASLNRNEETIRSQVKAIFTKTGTHSQAQLLKLLYALTQG